MTDTRAVSAVLAAQAWAAVWEDLDAQLSPLGLAAIEALAPQPGDAVLDLGCGAGQSTLQLAERVGPEGRVTGVDIASLLLDLARRRARSAPQIDFLQADARGLDLPSHSFDAVFSRFGVMAFTDPEAAFRNFHRLLRPGGRIGFVCWRALEENELDHLPLRAAGLENRANLTPFALADKRRIHAILSAAAFQRIVVEAQDHIVSSGDLDRTLEVLLKVGPLGRLIREDPTLRAEAEPRVRTALADRMAAQSGLKTATWVVTAHA